MILAADAFIKNDHETAPFHANHFYRQTTSYFDELYICYLEREEERFPSFALYLDTKIQKTKIIFNDIVSLPISIIRSFHYNAMENSKNWESKLRCAKRGVCWKWSNILVQQRTHPPIEVFWARTPWTSLRGKRACVIIDRSYTQEV